MRPLSMIKIAMFVILVPGAALGDTELDVERIIEDVLKKKDENGEDKAQYMYMLGNICYNQEKYLEALKWYTEAAAKGHTDAQFVLGSMYINGMGIQKNIKKGRKLIISVAREGNAIAQYLFGQLMDIEKRYEEAYYWLTLARKQEKDLERAGLLSDSLSTRLDELEDLIGHKKINELQEETGDGWKPRQLNGGGSGFYIKEGLVLTNAHVIDSCNEVRVQGDYYYRVDVIKKASAVDLALLKISSDLPSEKHRHSAPFRSKSASLQLGEGIAVFGYPLPGSLSFEGNFTIGNVSSMEGSPTEITPSDAFQFTAPIQRGNSGGPVLDAAGNVVGIATEFLLNLYDDRNIAQNINFAVSLKAIRKFLKDAGVEPDSVSSSDTRKEWTEIARAAQKFTVPVLCFTDKP